MPPRHRSVPPQRAESRHERGVSPRNFHSPEGGFLADTNYDVEAMFKDIRAKERASGHEYVRLVGGAGGSGRG